mmetsp:Transcript_4889/g.9876  ORF Transcript_4889/g.9876 Transcript_4889/m.9876 type:complete len:182 (-) Transcript_4889:186-731(-)
MADDDDGGCGSSEDRSVEVGEDRVEPRSAPAALEVESWEGDMGPGAVADPVRPQSANTRHGWSRLWHSSAFHKISRSRNEELTAPVGPRRLEEGFSPVPVVAFEAFESGSTGEHGTAVHPIDSEKIATVLQQTQERLVLRGERLDALADQSDAMVHEASQYSNAASLLKAQMQGKYAKNRK